MDIAEIAEMDVLGNVMLSPGTLPAARVVFREGRFASHANGLVWSAIEELARAGRPFDPIAVLGRLAGTGYMTWAGGAPYLHTLLSRATPEVGAELRWFSDHHGG